MKFNINNYVRVRLTETGKKELIRQAKKFRKDFPSVKNTYILPKEYGGGWSRWQLWTLMDTFGSVMHMGFDPPFETDIEMEEPDKGGEKMYDYEMQKSELFTEQGQKLFLAIRDQVADKLSVSGAVTMGAAISLPPGIGAANSWEMMACVDRLAELDELWEIPTSGSAQRRVFVKGRE